MQFDYDYLCQGLGHLTGLETRVYLDGSLAEHYRQYEFVPDVVELVKQQAFAREDSVCYIETEDLLIFGIVRSHTGDGATIIIGPTSQIAPGKNEAISVLHQLGAAYGKLPELMEYFANMVPYPLENFLGILCFLNYAINGEKRAAADLIMENRPSQKAPARQAPSSEPAVFDELEQAPHNTWQMEKQMLSCVSTGNMEALGAFLQTPAAGRVGALAQNELRQRKNTFIVSATLISRAAIAGGLPTQTAFALSDRYIQKAELLNSGSDLALLSMEMLIDYTERVSALKYGAANAPFARGVIRHIMQNLGGSLTTAGIAQSLGMNRQHLCERFRGETGMTVNECVTKAKIDEAKRLLETTNLSVAQVSEYLAYSTQSYFQTVFKKALGCTPKEYRAQTEAAGQDMYWAVSLS